MTFLFPFKLVEEVFLGAATATAFFAVTTGAGDAFFGAPEATGLDPVAFGDDEEEDATISLDCEGTGNEIDPLNIDPRRRSGAPSKATGAPRNILSRPSYTPKPSSPAPTVVKVDAGVFRTDTTIGSREGAGSIMRGAKAKIRFLFLTRSGRRLYSSTKGNNFST